MNVHPRSVRLAALLVVALIAGCTSVAPTTGPTSGSASTAAPEATAPDLRISEGAVPAGRYRLFGFEPGITVELDGEVP